MNRITQIIHGRGTVSDMMKHTRHHPGQLPSRYLAFSKMTAPVVFWNLTTQCNLSCRHCYNRSGPGGGGDNELNTSEAFSVIDDLAGMRVPLVLLSGGEPLLREDFWELVNHAWVRGLRLALSTNGTLITREIAGRLRASGIQYVGISVDGSIPETHDRARNSPGSFHRAMRGIGYCLQSGLQCGIRFTITRENQAELGDVFRMASQLGIPRFCLYWLVPSGRGRDLARESQLTPGEAVTALELLYQEARNIRPGDMEVLTVDAPQDIAYILNRMEEDQEQGSGEGFTLARCMGAGCSAARKVVNIAPTGDIFPCQFAQEDQFLIGNVRDQKFSRFWNDNENPVISFFRQKEEHLEGKCRTCKSLAICGGGCRVRAFHETGNIAGDDPLCMFI